MILTDNNKSYKDMNEEEQLRFKIMKTVAVAKGINVDSLETDSSVNLDFRKGSNSEKICTALLKNFDIEEKVEPVKNKINKNTGEENKAKVDKK